MAIGASRGRGASSVASPDRRRHHGRAPAARPTGTRHRHRRGSGLAEVQVAEGQDRARVRNARPARDERRLQRPAVGSPADDDGMVGPGAVGKVIDDGADDGVDADGAGKAAKNAGEVLDLTAAADLEGRDGVAMGDHRDRRDDDRERGQPVDPAADDEDADDRDPGQDEEGAGEEPPCPTDRSILGSTAAAGRTGFHVHLACGRDRRPSSGPDWYSSTTRAGTSGWAGRRPDQETAADSRVVALVAGRSRSTAVDRRAARPGPRSRRPPLPRTSPRPRYRSRSVAVRTSRSADATPIDTVIGTGPRPSATSGRRASSTVIRSATPCAADASASGRITANSSPP